MTGVPDEALRAQACRTLAGMREATSACFGEAFASTPRLDMLAHLYLAEREHRTLHAWSLCLAAQVPASTAHRKIRELERQGLVACHRGAFAESRSDGSRRYRDHRYVRVSLTEEGRARTARLLDQLVEIWEKACPRDRTGSSA